MKMYNITPDNTAQSDRHPCCSLFNIQINMQAAIELVYAACILPSRIRTFIWPGSNTGCT